MDRSKLGDLLKRISDLEEVQRIFDELRAIDAMRVSGLEQALHKSIATSIAMLAPTEPNVDRLRYALYRQATEIGDFAKPLRGLAHMMVARDNELRKHAFYCTEQFFADVTKALDVYFAAKLKVMEKEIEDDAEWYTGIRDTAKKTGEVVNLGKVGWNKIRGLITHDPGDTDSVFDTRGISEKILDAHLSQDQIAADTEQILERITKKFKESWAEVIDQNAPTAGDLQALAGSDAAHGVLAVGFHLGAAESTLLMGIGSAVAATVGLAAGWHTITWALLHVFPPAAAFAVLATVAVAVFTKEKAKEQRIATLRKAVENYFRTLLTFINTEQLRELGDKTMRAAMLEQSAEIIEATMMRWTRAVIGELSMEDYIRLAAATDSHRQLIDECLELLESTR